MKIDRVTVRYGELRTSGFYGNTRHEVEYSAMLEPGDTAKQVRTELLSLAKQAVKKHFGDPEDMTNQEDLPF